MRKQITVVIADDNTLMRGTLRLILTEIGNVSIIGEAANGEEAINLVTTEVPDILIIDINMTPVNGFEATRKILKINPQARIIALSMHNKPSYARNMFQLGAYGYVCKSSPHHEILEAIKNVIDGNKYLDSGLRGKVKI